MTTFGDQLYQYGGAPVTNAGLPIVEGNVYWVNSAGSPDGGGGGDGSGPNSPLKTIDAAIGNCSTGNLQDLIIVGAGHAETVSAAATFACDKANVIIYGLGRYDTRPKFTYDTSGIVTNVTKAGVVLQNLRFVPDVAASGSVTAVANFLHFTGKGCRVEGCSFENGDTTGDIWLKAITGGTADNDYDGLEIINNSFHTYGATSTGAVQTTNVIDLLKNSIDVKIVGNTMAVVLTTGTAAIYSVNTEVHQNILVAHNIIYNPVTSGTTEVAGVSIASTGSTGWVIYNHCQHLIADSETPFLGGSGGLYFGENYASGVAGTASGYLLPAADS